MACPVTAPLLAERKFKKQVAEGRNGGDSAVLRALELTEAIYRLRALPLVVKMEPLAPMTTQTLRKLRHNT